MSDEEYEYWLSQGYSASYLEEYRHSDQTLAFYDLNKADEYYTAWENMASALRSKSVSKSSFKTLVTSAKYFAVDEDNSYQYYGMIDAKDFVNKLSNHSSYKPDASITNAVLEAFSDLVVHSAKGDIAGNANGLSMYFPAWSACGRTTYYGSGSSYTTFSEWRQFAYDKGY